MRPLHRRFPRSAHVFLVAVLGLVLTQTATGQLPADAFSRMFSSSAIQAGPIRWHYISGGSGDVVVLLHGWPQTWFEWRDVMPDLAKRYRVIAADLPGLGDSAEAASYDKKSLAQHLRRLMAELKITSFHLVGHDMGGIVAYAYARQFPGDLKSVVLVDTPIPGLTGWDGLRSQWPRWHFAFHNLPDLPEALVSGRERIYLNWFFQTLAYNKTVFSDARVDRYVQAYSRPSTLHAGFEYYRAFEKDAADNEDHATAKVSIPVLSIGGANSRLNKYVVDQLRAGTTRLTGDLAPESGHWIPEEQPAWLAKRLLDFFASNSN
jgi:pimeloyl-ACP methyl ester carboxylesterase